MKFCRNGTQRYNPILLSLSFSLATRALIQAWSPKRFFCDPGCAQSDVSDSPGCRPLPQKSFSGDDTMRYWGRERWLAVMIALCIWWAGNNYHALKTIYRGVVGSSVRSTFHSSHEPTGVWVFRSSERNHSRTIVLSCSFCWFVYRQKQLISRCMIEPTSASFRVMTLPSATSSLLSKIHVRKDLHESCDSC